MKKQRNKWHQRVLALVLACMLCVGMMPLAAFAVSAGDKCPIEGCGGTILLSKDGSSLICDTCVEFSSVPVQPEKPEGPEKPTEPEEHVHSYGDNDRCECGALNPAHKHSYDENGKCICGDQHTHSWNYSMYDRTERFTHKAYCSCGATKEEACTTQEVIEWGQKVVKCTLCGYWEPVEDVHHWGEWKPNGNGTHSHSCTGSDCTETRTEECELTAKNDGTVSCDVCGWVKYNDGKPGDGGSTECEHEFGNVGKSVDTYHHTLECLKCSEKVTFKCELDVLKVNGQPVAHYCKVCGNQVSIRNDDNKYCSDTDDGHEWKTTKEVISEDGTSVLTTLTCENCGLVKVTDICTSPAKVVVKYQYEDGKEAHPSQSQSVINGTYYSILSPKIEGYKPDIQIVFGTSDGKGQEIIVTYKKACTLTIKYHFADCEKEDEQVAPDYTATLLPYEEYSVESPAGPLGYAPEEGKETVVGKMGAEDTLETVKYSPIPYTWTIYYVDKDGKTLRDPQVIEYTVENVKKLETPEIPEVQDHKFSTDNIAETKPTADKLGNVESKVVYEPILVQTHYEYTVRWLDKEDLGEEIRPAEVRFIEAGKDIRIDSESDKTVEGYTFCPDDSDVYVPAANVAANGNTELKLVFTKEKTVTVTWVDEDGTELHKLENVKLGEIPAAGEYTTLSGNGNPTKAEDATYTYAFSGWSAADTDSDGNVTYTAQYTPTAKPVTPPVVIVTPDDPTPTPTPTPDPDEDDEIEDPDVPLGPGPVEPTPTPTPDPDEDDEIEDPDVPLGPGPVEPTPTPTPGPDEDDEIEDPDVPLAPGPVESTPTPKPNTAPEGEEIPDEVVPLSDAPKTGDDMGVWQALAVLSAAGLALMGIFRKRNAKNI